MSKRHFVKLAAIIAAVGDKATREELCSKVGQLCKRENPAFDWYRWRAACGCGDG